MKVENIKKGDRLVYSGHEVEVTMINEVRISFKSVKENWSCGNIPLFERRPGNKLTNIEMLEPKTLINTIKAKFRK